MKPNAKKHRIIVALCASLISASQVFGDAQSVQVIVDCEVRKISVWEALPLSVTFTNQGNSDVMIDTRIFTSNLLGGVMVVSPDGSERMIRQSKLKLIHKLIPGEDFRRVLGPGKSHRFQVLLSCDWDDPKRAHIFESEGLYELQVNYDDGSLTLSSNTIQVTVGAAPPTESRALDAMKGTENTVGLYAPELTVGSAKSEEYVSTLERFADFKESVIFANYARLALAKRAMEWSERTSDETKRVERLQLAEKWLGLITREPPAIKREIEEVRRKLEEYKVNPPRP